MDLRIVTLYDRGDSAGHFRRIYPRPVDRLIELQNKINPNPRTPEEALENQEINKEIKKLKHNI